MKILSTLCLALPLLAHSAYADVSIKTFNSDSYAQILTEHPQQALLISIWSVDCPSCLKDMAVLQELHKKHPKLPIILLSTDEASAAGEVQAILQRNHLQDLENWQFGAEDAEKLRYQIDPKWYGELPRSYAFNLQQQRQAKSGAMDLAGFEQWLKAAGAIQ